ncbi:response regulator transcription factor [Hydrogenovibrio sp. 3SP14C1]|uniref:response regulator transcription factor n=1 Tax=Hydrogenovibrio sp. 3SP14C1 TaxID=3038774 RepID=UPI002417A75F|nr:response regulator transcription factor [Hydrogenovibrio sp. 3SP14C1]MDG4813222.1 response regulator transcription factor [Hydrogenovibrio sp. 3SP14C1]
MKQLLLYVQDPHALKNWSKVSSLPKQILYTLEMNPKMRPVTDNLLLIQLTSDPENTAEIEAVLQQGYTVLLFSNQPSAAEGVAWFQKGIKGYVNTFSQPSRIEQALNTILDGNIWLGQNVMQGIIQAVSSNQAVQNDSWKEKLSAREIETMEWILQGKSNHEIAEQMIISERTVKAHVHSLLEKLDAKDRLNLVIKIQNWRKNAL